MKNSPEERRNALLKWRYGITSEQYDILLEIQNGVCKICRKAPLKRRLHVDHNHITGRVRGLLCHKCNVGIGHFNDDIELFKRVLNYLTE